MTITVGTTVFPYEGIPLDIESGNEKVHRTLQYEIDHVVQDQTTIFTPEFVLDTYSCDGVVEIAVVGFFTKAGPIRPQRGLCSGCLESGPLHSFLGVKRIRVGSYMNLLLLKILRQI